MRISTSWLAKRLDLRTDAQTAARTREFVDAFVELGMEVEDVHELGVLDGPVVIGRVATIEVLTGFKKPIRFCQVEVGELSGDVEDEDAADDENLRGIICGATNFAEGDLVVVALPGAVLPGDFTITARKTYGRISDGMICSARELGIGDEHAGILVLPSGFAEPGTDAVDALKLRDSVIELEITPDRGYCLSVRGLARELAAALDLDYNDPAGPPPPKENADSWPVRVADSAGCPRFVARRITGVDVGAPTPWWMRRRLMSAGIRSISLVVDVTNYVMLELGQPLHAYDAGKLSGPITVRRANPGEKLTTLDDVQRVLDVDDLVICDDSGPIGLAGVMGGASTEIDERSTDIVLEGAHFDPRSIARAARRHKLPSEASRRFERFVDPALPPSAVDMAARLLGQLGDGNVEPGRTDVGGARRPVSIEMPIDLPDQVAGVRYARGATVRRLTQIGCHNELNVESGRPVIVSTPPTWRNDLAEPIDLVEEVLRLEGYDQIPSELPPAPPGRGLTRAQRRRRTVSRALAEAGYVEVLPFPFVDGSVFDAFGLADDDVRRNTVRVLNPLDADRAELATTLLPGMLETLQRNVSRGAKDVALFAIEQVFLPHAERRAVPALGVGARPSDAELAMMEAALPAQPVHVAVVLAGDRRRAGWWGAGEPAMWADAVAAARLVGQASGVTVTVSAATLAPWHPGRCAELRVGGWPIGHAGELHPKVVDALGLPKRTCAMELDLDVIPLSDNGSAPIVSPYPPVLLDVALVVDSGVPAATVADALRSGGGELLEGLALFDVYTGEQVGDGKRSLAYSLTFRAVDRTLTVEEASKARDAAVAAAAERVGATLRG